jgi:hypothetical protein
VIAGGAGVLVLEEYEHAKARGAKIYAEFVGYGATSDGYDMVAPSGEGAMRCMRQALATVKTPIDYINPHATSTPVGDAKEIEALREVFGTGDKCPPLSATKSLSGHSLGAPGVVEAMREKLFPLASVITPNLPEAARLAGVDMPADEAGLEHLARILAGQGVRAVLVKGGHLSGATAEDVLFEGGQVSRFSGPRVNTKNTHGTGCTLSSAIAAHLAKGLPLAQAVQASKDYLTQALRAADALEVGQGHGPVHHFTGLWR